MISNPKIALVVPCFNEANRLQLFEFEEFLKSKSQFVVFVDDGSTDQTRALLQDFAASRENCLVHVMNKNSGKAEAVRQGMLFARERFTEVDWIGFWDADLATPLFEVANMLAFFEKFGRDRTKVIMGSRVSRLGSKIVRSPMRHYISRIIVTIISMTLKVRAYDSQCGAKLFHRDRVSLFEKSFVTKWLFDVELLVRGQQSEFLEYPLQQWIDVAGSKVKLKDGIMVFRDIFTIWKTYRQQIASGQHVE